MRGQVYKLGEIIGKNTIISIEKNVKNQCIYVVKCECGWITKKNSFILRKELKCLLCKSLKMIGTKNYKCMFLKYISAQKFECKCDCGNFFIGEIRSKSCGCHIEERYINRAKKIEGAEYGAIKIISFSHFENMKNTNRRQAIYNAKCKCGCKFKIDRKMISIKMTCGCNIISNHARGTNHHNNKHPQTSIEALKSLFLTGCYSKKDLSEMFEIPLSQICDILQGKSWKFVKFNTEQLKSSPVKDQIFKKIPRVEIGKNYGEWLPLYQAASKKRHSYYLCRCSCGAEREVQGKALIHGRTTKCSDCGYKRFIQCRKVHDYPSFVGKKVGSRTVLEFFIKDQKKFFRIKCDCGNEKIVTRGTILYSKSKHCDRCYPKKRLAAIL